jgi:molybdopterin-guanine dinucleotide biosynthesis protein A
MSAWILEALKRSTKDQVVITPEPEIALALGVRGRPDKIRGAGPLGGLHAALNWAQEEGREGVFLMACDLPMVTGELISRIVEKWPSEAPAALPGSPGPLGFEPLCAGYGTAALGAVEELLHGAQRSMDSVLSVLDVVPIPSRELGGDEELELAFTNVNTEEMADRTEALLVGQRESILGEGTYRWGERRASGTWEVW